MKNDDTVKSKKTKKIIIGIIVAVAVIYGIFIVYKLIKNPSNTFIVENGTISEEETVSGYIIRDEEVIEEKNKKTIIKIKEEGQRVAKGDSVFRYYSDKEGELESKIAELDGKIQAVLENEENLLPNDKKLLESQIENELDKVNGQNEISKLAEYKKTISSYITKKAKIIGENSPSGSYLKGLIEERTSYEEKLKQESEYITAPSAGMVSYKIDGLEKVLTTDNLNTFNKQFLQDLDLKVGKAIASSDVTAKIVNNYNNYIVFNSNSQEAKNAKVNDKVNIKVQNDEAIVAKIQNIIEEDDGSRTIAISVEKNIEELLSYRRISLDIIWWSASGYRVPNSAIKEIDNVTYVVRNRNGYLNKMAVKVLKKGEDYSIVDSYSRDELLNLGLSSKEISDLKTLTLYDEILLNPKDEQLLQ
ncbi:MAG: HlyD family efflux transporter periplasmic adaptor subunit [Christensenellales bacterium]